MNEKDYKMVLFTDKILYTPCDSVVEVTDEIMNLVSKMILLMQINNGVGLSANQIGVSKQVCVIAVENKTKLMAVLNPIIIKKSKEKIKIQEGCLSSPGIFVATKRSKKVVVSCMNLKGESCAYEFTDLDARIVQHEIDHLNGKTIVSPYMQYIKK